MFQDFEAVKSIVNNLKSPNLQTEPGLCGI